MCLVQKSMARTNHPMVKAEIVTQIRVIALEHGVDPDLAVAIATVESRIEPNTVGLKGEIGLFQLRPEYHPVVKGDVLNNIRTAIRYLAELKVSCASYGEAYFVCYNYGPSRKLNHPTLFPYYKRVKVVLGQSQNNLSVAQAE
jgi:soluble lytic murein transglycosylase-like protein